MNRLEIIKEVYGEREWSETALLHLMKVIELTAKECIDKIETYKFLANNSSASKLIYTALTEIRDDIKDHFGVEYE